MCLQALVSILVTTNVSRNNFVRFTIEESSPLYDRCFIETGILFRQLFACSWKTNIAAIVGAEQIQHWAVCASEFFSVIFRQCDGPLFVAGIFVSCQSATRHWSRSLSSARFAHHCYWDRICPKRKRYSIEHKIFRKILSFRNRIFLVRALFLEEIVRVFDFICTSANFVFWTLFMFRALLFYTFSRDVAISL